jgi:hypothetical protein
MKMQEPLPDVRNENVEENESEDEDDSQISTHFIK